MSSNGNKTALQSRSDLETWKVAPCGTEATPRGVYAQCRGGVLTLRRGEHVRCQHDVTLWGIISGRVVSRALNSDGNLISIDLDELCAMEAGKSYGIRVSTPTNVDVYYSVQTVPGVSRTLALAMPIPATSSAPDIGDLVSLVSLDVRISF